MKITHLLKEAKLQARDFYQESRLDALLYMLEKGQPFTMTDGSKSVIKASPSEIKYLKSLRSYYDAGGNSKEVKDYIPRTIGGVKLTDIFKSSEFGGRGGTLGQEKSEGPVVADIGATVEAMKSAAIYTKLITRDSPTISVEDVINTLKEIGSSGQEIVDGKKISMMSTLKATVPDSGGNVKDQFTLNVNLARAPFQRATELHANDKDARGRLNSIVNYVNKETDLAKYNRFFTNNQKRDPVFVEVKGLEGKKADVETSYLKDGEMKPLSHLSMSLKAGSSKYDQASGLNEAGNIKFFNILGLSIEDAREAMKVAKFKNDLDHERRTRAVVKLYSQAATMLDREISRLNDKGESQFIHSVIAKLRSSIQGDQKLVYVNFNADGTYYKLNPQLIANLATYVNLDVKMVMKKWPYLYVYDTNTGKNLFHARLAVNSTGRLTHIFELDDLLDLVKEATASAHNSNITHVQEPNAQPVAAPATKAATPKAATPKAAPIKTATVPQGPGKSITSVAPGMATTPNPYTLQQPEEEPVAETGNDKDLDYIKRMAGILGQMSKHS